MGMAKHHSAAAALLVLVALAVTRADGRSLAQADNATEPTASNPYTANLNDRPTKVEARMGIGGADVRVVDASAMPGLDGTGLSTHLVKLLPCSSLAPHYHPTAHELQYVLEGEQGNLTFVIVDLAGTTYTKAVGKGDVNIIPSGLVHYIANEGCSPATVDLIFSGNMSRVNLAPSIMQLGNQMAVDMLGLGNGTVLEAPMGDIIPITSSGCPAKCEGR